VLFVVAMMPDRSFHITLIAGDHVGAPICNCNALLDCRARQMVPSVFPRGAPSSRPAGYDMTTIGRSTNYSDDPNAGPLDNP